MAAGPLAALAPLRGLSKPELLALSKAELAEAFLQMVGICDEIVAQYGAAQQAAAEPKRKRQAVETAGSEPVAAPAPAAPVAAPVADTHRQPRLS
jgi:hypothetical protein